MKSWFANLELREQRFVIAALVFAAFAALYMGAWLPVDKGQRQMHASVENWQRSVDTLRQLKGRVGAATGSEVSPGSLTQPLVVVIDSSLRARNMAAPQRSQPTGNDIRVEFENVSFDEIMLWLGDLGSQYALEVKSGSFTRTSSQARGRVNAQLTLGR